jgi:hypothetical protein
MSDCPNCGGDVDRGRWAPGGCTCRREPEQGGDPVGDALDAAESFDYITPVAEVTGTNKHVLLIFAMIGTFGVILTKGILWG